MKAFEPARIKPTAKAIALIALVFSMAFMAGTFLHTADVNGGSSDHGTAESPLTSMITTTIDVDSTAYYLAVGSTVRVDSTNTYVIDDYTDGYGLTYKDGAVYGTISKAGTIVIKIVNIADGDDFYHFTIYSVEASSTKVTSVIISAGSSSVNMGDLIALYATTFPEDAADRTVTWSIVSGSTRATIQSQSDTAGGGGCILKGIAAGTVIVQAKADGGTDAVATMSITVIQTYTYTLYYNANGGSVGPIYSSNVATDKTSTLVFTISSSKPLRDGYTFLGWSTSPTATSASYQPGDKISVTYDSVTLYAVWQDHYRTYSLKFDANQGYNAPSQLTGTSNTGSCTFTIPASQPARSGYTFLGWSESSTASSASYMAGSTYTAASTSVTLYAVWKQSEYTCTLDYSASGASNVPSKQTYTGTSTSEHTFTIASNKPAKDNCRFLGWSKTNGSPTAEYQPGGLISVAFDGSITLYAVWGEIAYTSTLKYSAEGATNVPEDDIYNGSSTESHSFTISLMEPEKEGYRFLGWSESNMAIAAEYQPGSTIHVPNDGCVTLYAVWMQSISITSYPSLSCLIGSDYVYVVSTDVSGCVLTVTGASWLNVSGNIVSGTPTSAGLYKITVTASKDGCISASQTFELKALTGFDSVPSADGIYAYAR